jgi:glyoxylase-like metal-dependent hydrolase (beta-lactamase superfamily II)
MGDLFFNGRFPFVDLSSGGSVDGYLAGVEAVLAEVGPETKIIPGHGPLATRKDLEAFRRMLVETVRIVRDRKEHGMSLEDSKKAGLPDEWKGWGWEFVSAPSWVETIWKSLDAKK